MSNEKKPTASEITDTLIQEWKAKHNKVAKYKTEDGKVAYFRNPSISEMEASTTIAQDKKPIQSNRFLAKACFLGGDVAVYEDQKYLIGLGKVLGKMVDSVEGELEEL